MAGSVITLALGAKSEARSRTIMIVMLVDTQAPVPSNARARERESHTVFESHDGPCEGEAVLEGALPEWLSGRLVRTAPVLEVGAYRAAHWFDGLGMLYRLDLERGRVRFAQRLLETKALAAARAGRMTVSTFAGRNERSFLKRLVQPIPPMTDNTNVHIVPTPDGWLAMTETPHQYLIDGDTLGIKREVRYHDAIGPLAGMLAHPEWDARMHQLVNVATKIGAKTELIVYRHGLGESERRPIAHIPIPELAYMHAFGLTEKKVVLVAPPLHARPLSFLWSNKGFIDHFRWHGERPTRVFVIDRATGAVSEHEADPFFFFHTVNAFDDGDGVVLDLCTYPDSTLIDRLRADQVGTGLGADARLERLRVAPGKRVTREALDAGNLEFPSVHRALVAGRRHRRVFGAALESSQKSALRALDLDSGRSQSFAREGVVYGEPVFVPRPGSAREGDGVLLSVGSDLTRGAAELVVLAAESLEPLATARLPIPIPLGFHGSFQLAR